MAQPVREGSVDARTQEKVWRLLEQVIADYWDGESKNASGTNTAGGVTNVEAAFRAASNLMPERLDLKFGIASSLIGQAVGTNGAPLKIKLNEALAVYQDIAALAPDGFDAPLLYAAYSRAAGKTNAADATFKQLMAIRPARTKEYLEMFDCLDRILRLTPNEAPQRGFGDEKRHAIVVLGAGLETNGLIKPKLVSRLEKCRRLARMYPRAPVILTGGNPKSGVTEAYAMREWCLRKGIRKKRIWLEDKARDTVENAIYTSVILEKLGITDVTLITSASHMRRGLADFEEACRQRRLSIQFTNLAARIKTDVELDKEQEQLGVYRDVLRVSGLWAFPGIRR